MPIPAATAVEPDFKVWDGVYPSFAAAPAVGPGFDGPIWHERSRRAAREAYAEAEAGEPLDYGLRQRNSLLPTVVASMLGRQDRVRVLDFGGGFGLGYLLLTRAMPSAIARVDYTVVESAGICETGRDLFAGNANPSFRDRLPDAALFDIVHAASVIQYIGDWRALIRQLVGYGARYLSLADIFIGDFSTFVTLQNYYDSRIRHWFFNAAEFIGAIEGSGYQLALRVPCDAKILGRYGPLPMDNFPEKLRISNTTNLLFRDARTEA